MNKQVRLQSCALRFLRQRIYERVKPSFTQLEIHFAFIDEFLYLRSLKRFSKLEDYMLNYIANILDSDMNDYLTCLERYGKE